jgi:MFS family permease
MAKSESLIYRTFVSLNYRDFRLVWLGSVTEHIGEWMEMIALLWLVNELTGSPFMLTLVGSCRYIPMVIFPILGGMVADITDRRRLLISALLGAALLSIILAILVKTGTVAIWHIIVLSLLSGVTTSLNHPARQSIVPNLITREHLLNAIALDSASVQASRLVATPLAGYLIACFGVVPVFGLRAAGALLAVCWLLFVNIRLLPPATTKAPWRNVVEGLKYVRGNILLLSMVPLYLLPMLTQNTYSNFLPIFARDILKIGPTGYGFLQGAPGLGALASLIGLASLASHRVRGSLLFTASGIIGIGFVLFSVSNWTFFSLFLLVTIGGTITSFMTINTALIQSHVSDVMRGRVMSLREIAFGLGPVGSLIFGAIAEQSSVSLALGFLGSLCIILSLSLFLLLPKVRTTRV